MNRFVEMMKEHEILDALRITGLSEDNIDVHKAFQLESIARNVPEMTIGTLTFGKFRLAIEHYGKHDNFSSNYSDKEMVDLINNDLDMAFYASIVKYDDYVYVLNIAYEDYYGPSGNKPWGPECPPETLHRHLGPYMPIIQKFMVDALTDNLYIMEDGKLVKQ